MTTKSLTLAQQFINAARRVGPSGSVHFRHHRGSSFSYFPTGPEGPTRASSSRQRLTGARPVPGKPCTVRESNRNCVAAKRGGEQRKERMQTLTKVNRIRPSCGPSLRVKERRQARLERDTWSAHPTVKHGHGRMEVIAESMHSKGLTMKMRELTGKATGGSPENRSNRLNKADERWSRRCLSVVRVPIVVKKPGNAGGAKGGRKMNGGHP